MKNLMVIGISLSLILQLIGCSSPGPKVIETADNNSKPSWAKTTKPSFEKDGKVYFIAWVEVDGMASKAAALNMSDEKAMSEPFRSLVDEFLDQNQVGEELRKEASVGQRIISATRGYRPPMPSLKITERYWEKLSLGEYGPFELRAFTLTEQPIADYEAAKQAYLNRLAGNSEVKKILDDVGEKQRRKVLGE